MSRASSLGSSGVAPRWRFFAQRCLAQAAAERDFAAELEGVVGEHFAAARLRDVRDRFLVARDVVDAQPHEGPHVG